MKESLIPLRWIGPKGRLLDVGTGNGFPAIPILACRLGLEAVLVERSEKKSLFLDAVIREAELGGVRIETRDLGRQQRATSSSGVKGSGPPVSAADPQVNGAPHRTSEAPSEAASKGGFDFVISRATLTPSRYLALASSWIAPGGRVFLYAGREAERHFGSASGFSMLACQPIPDRRDSYLFVLQAG